MPQVAPGREEEHARLSQLMIAVRERRPQDEIDRLRAEYKAAVAARKHAAAAAVLAEAEAAVAAVSDG